MVRQWFSISALLALAMLLAAADAGRTQERRLLGRFRGGSDNTATTTSEPQAKVADQAVIQPSGTPVASAPTEVAPVRERRFFRRFRGYSETSVSPTPQTPARQAMYPPDSTMRQSPVYLSVRLPAFAELLFEGSKTMQMGSMRYFISPPINVDRTYVYEITAKWMEDGKVRSQIRKVDVRAGQNLVVDLTQPIQETDKIKR